MLVLFETAAGYAIFKLLDEKKLQKSENLYLDFQSPESANKVVKLKDFHKFEDTTEALAAATASVEGKMTKSLKKILKKLVVKEAQQELAVADAKLGNVIKDKLDLQCVYNSNIHELMRCIRSQIDGLVIGLPKKEMSAMALGLAHSLSRYKLKFSPDKVDTMIVQAISLLDDLDKELNNYVMRAKEWYGWHFPELASIVSDYIAYSKVVQLIGDRTNAATTDLSDILPEDLEQDVKKAAEISMGTEVSDEDIINIKYLCEQIVEIANYRTMLYDYLKNRMMAIAPNVTVLVGELVGARLVAHAGSLMNLAKHPASTVQILGAEKALFRALKTHHDTPKYGMIYHASLISQSNTKFKGKMSRMLAAKTSLAARVDALSDDTNAELGLEHRARLELRLKQLEEGISRKISGTGRQKAQFDRYANTSEIRTYKTGMDSTIGHKRKIEEIKSTPSTPKTPTASTPKTPTDDNTPVPKKKRKKLSSSGGGDDDGPDEVNASQKTPKSAGKKNRPGASGDDQPDESQTPTAGEDKKKKKKKKSMGGDDDADVSVTEPDVTQKTPKSGKKSKKKAETAEDEASPDVAVAVKARKKQSMGAESGLDTSQDFGESFVSEDAESSTKKKKKKGKKEKDLE